MFPKKAQNTIEIPTNNDGLYEITITSKDNKPVFTDCISSKDKKIILKGFSQKLYNITLTPILFNKPFEIF